MFAINIMSLIALLAIVYMVLRAIGNHRDSYKMNFMASVAKEATYIRGTYQMFRLGAAVMYTEANSMRAASAIFGFTNAKLLSQSESVQALISSLIFKLFWVLLVGLIALLNFNFEYLWVGFILTGLFFVVLKFLLKADDFGYMCIYVGIIMLVMILARGTAIQFASQNIDFNSLCGYTMSNKLIGLVLTSFIGIVTGMIFPGNILAVLLVSILMATKLVGVECSIMLLVGNEVGTLLPMSLMAGNTNVEARQSFLFYAIILSLTYLLDIVILALIPISFISKLGMVAVIIGYMCCVTIMVPLVYFAIGAKIWSKVSRATHQQLSEKTHLHEFPREYRHHVCISIVQAEKEISNLQYRIHKMIDFIIDMIDEDENRNEIFQHIVKYRDIVNRNCEEIISFVMSQTSTKNNEYISILAQERLEAVVMQRRLGENFYNISKAITNIEKEKYPIIRRCIVALETLFNQTTKLINSRYNVEDKNSEVLKSDVEYLSSHLCELLKEYGADESLEVLPYCILNSKELIVKIIDNLKIK